MIDFSINLGNILTVVAFIVGGVGFVYTMQSRIEALSTRMISLEGEIKKMVDVMLLQARHDERMNAMDQRLSAQGSRLDELAQRVNLKFD